MLCKLIAHFIFHAIATNIYSAVAENIWCNSPYACSNKTMNASDVNENLLAAAYKSNYGRKSQLIGYEIQVVGSNAAQYASLIQGNVGVDCYGYKSCADVKLLLLTDYTLYCGGIGACTNSHISVPNALQFLSCQSEMSCANTIINNTYNIFAGGAYCLYNSIIDASLLNDDGNNFFTIIFKGYMSGYNATIINNGNRQKGSIHCYGNGCFGVKLICSDNSNYNISECNNFVLRNCDGFDIPCPNFIYNNSSTDSIILYNTNNKSSDTFEANYDKYVNYYSSIDILNIIDTISGDCGQHNSYQFDEYYANDYTTTSIESDFGSICCRGYVSCYKLEQFSISILKNNNYNNSNILCSGRSSCRYANTIEILNSSNYNNIFCVAPYSCSEATISIDIQQSAKSAQFNENT